MRLRSVTVIVVSILLVAIASVAYALGGIPHLLRLDRPAPGVPPIAIGAAWDCPSGHGVKAYAKDRLYYPPPIRHHLHTNPALRGASAPARKRPRKAIYLPHPRLEP